MGKKNYDYSQFELTQTTEENSVFIKSVNVKGKSSKQLKAIKENLPTTTLHYFSEEEFNRLKTIELELIKEFEKLKDLELQKTKKSKSSIMASLLIRFLEI